MGRADRKVRQLSKAQEEREFPDAYIALDTPCIGCGYNLKTLAVRGKCPECGHSVEGTVNLPFGRRVVGLVRLAGGLMAANAVCLTLSIYCLHVRPRNETVGNILGLCGVPLLSLVELVVLATLAGKAHSVGCNASRSLLLLAFGCFVAVNVIVPMVLSNGWLSAVIMSVLLVGPVWLCEVLLPIARRVTKETTWAYLRFVRFLAWGIVPLGGLQIYEFWDPYNTSGYYGFVEAWRDHSGGVILALLAAGIHYCAGRVAWEVGQSMRQYPRVR